MTEGCEGVRKKERAIERDKNRERERGRERERERVVIYERAVRARGSFHTFLQSLFLERLRGRKLSLRRSSSVRSRRASAEARGPRAFRRINGNVAPTLAAAAPLDLEIDGKGDSVR